MFSLAELSNRKKKLLLDEVNKTKAKEEVKTNTKAMLIIVCYNSVKFA